MRQAFRVTGFVVLAYLLQSTVLPYLKVFGVMIDLMTITVFTIGYACGTYAGILSGMMCAMFVEVLAGDPAGLSIVYPVIGYVGSWSVKRIREYNRAGNRGFEKNVKRFGPMVLLGGTVAAKEFIYLAFFYLTGMDISFGHVSKVVLSGVVSGILALLLLPVIYRLLLREGSLIVKWWKKRRAKSKLKPVEAERKDKRKRRDRAASGKESIFSLLNPVLDESDDDDEDETDSGENLPGESTMDVFDDASLDSLLTDAPGNKPEREEIDLSIYQRPKPQEELEGEGGRQDDTAEDDDDLEGPPEGGFDD